MVPDTAALQTTAVAGHLCETAGHQLARGARFHFDTRFFFERLDYGGGVLFSEAKRNGRFEIFFDNAERRGG